MVSTKEIKNLLVNMNEDSQSNAKRIINLFGSLEYVDEDNQSILHILVDNIYDEEKCFLAIKSLLKCGLDPNTEADFQYNFIQTALYAGYSEVFIKKIIIEALKYGLKINHRDDDLDTIMHTAIYSDDYLGEVESIYDLLHENGFDSTLVDHDSRNLVEAMIYQKQYSQSQIESFKSKFIDRTRVYKDASTNVVSKVETKVVSTPVVKKQVSITNIPDEDLKELEKFGRILNKNIYLTSPTIGRDREVKNLMVTLAQNKKCPLIVGESGVGKTTVVEELVYRIINGNVPNILQGKLILEVNPQEIVAGCQYLGMFEDNMAKLMSLCEKYGIILFIDELHETFGIGSTKGKDSDMASMLKFKIDRKLIKVIGTTTDKEYEEYFSSDAFKRRFEKVPVKEPEDRILYEILDKVLNDYFINDGIMLSEESLRGQIISIIMEATNKKHRVYNDIVNNPDLAISIIDKAIAFAKVYDSDVLTVEHLIESLECCDRIYETVRNTAIERLKHLKPKQNGLGKILTYDFNKSKK